MMEKLRRIWKTPAVRNNLLFVIAMLVVFRIAAHIPVPGVDTENLRRFLEGNQILGLLNLFSGGTMQNFSIVLMGVGPYITASIIFQLLTMVVPSLEELSKEGESGQQKINMYTRLATVPLAFLQAYSMIKLLSSAQYGIITDLTPFKMVSIMLTVTAGTVFLMWIGELITERKIGNGVSLLIFAGIVASLPTTLQNLAVNYTGAELYTYLLYLALAIVTIVGVVVISEGQRNIPVNYARQIRGNRNFGGAKSTLPLRLNMAGVIPIIFAISLIIFPTLVAQFFVNGTGRSAQLAQFVTRVLSQTSWTYAVLYFLLVVGFTYFYTAIIFQPQKMAENLQRQGAFIPGIRPGHETSEYIGKTMSLLLFPGALFLGAIAILPLLVQHLTGTQLAIGGTSLLIVVSVAIETTKQINAQLTMYEYDRV